MVVGERCRGDAETLSPHEDAVDTARGKIERRTALPGMATSYPAVAVALSTRLVLVSLLLLFLLVVVIVIVVLHELARWLPQLRTPAARRRRAVTAAISRHGLVALVERVPPVVPGPARVRGVRLYPCIPPLGVALQLAMLRRKELRVRVKVEIAHQHAFPMLRLAQNVEGGLQVGQARRAARAGLGRRLYGSERSCFRCP